MSNRAERRRQSRAHQKEPVLVVGDGIVAAQIDGHTFKAEPSNSEPEKIPGKHRWNAMACYWLTDDEARSGIDDPANALDNSRLGYLAIGCFDCERVLGEISPEDPCPAGKT